MDLFALLAYAGNTGYNRQAKGGIVWGGIGEKL